MFNNNSKTILVTGCAGFIGSNFVPYFLEKYTNYNLVNLDLLTYAGDLENLKECETNPRYKFIKGDICNRELVEFIFNEYDIQGVIHFAAESHVDNSIKNPGVFVETNVNGTFTLIDVAYKYWMNKPFTYKDKYKDCRFHHISTDEVYGTLSDDPKDLFTETTPYAPNSPYSASKTSSDMIVRAYAETYKFPMNITRCSNNYGPNHFPEKLIPLCIHNILNNKPLPIYGDGKFTRDWLFVIDHARAIDLVFHNGKNGDSYNVGGFNEWKNIDLVKELCKQVDDKLGRAQGTAAELITFVKDRPGHDLRYAIDASKINRELGYKPSVTFEEGLSKTIDWYLNNQEWLDQVTSGEYQNYYQQQYQG